MVVCLVYFVAVLYAAQRYSANRWVLLHMVVQAARVPISTMEKLKRLPVLLVLILLEMQHCHAVLTEA